MAAGTGAAHERSTLRRLLRGFALLPLLALGVALGVALPLMLAPSARAANPAQIAWDSSMIYSGQNNGNPEGPVGEHAKVHGSNFTEPDGTALALQLVQGDVNSAQGSAYEFCKLSTTKVALPGTVTEHGGAFDSSFDWPSGASSGQWSICAYTPDGLPAGGGNTNAPGPFTVLSSDAPEISLSATSVAAGGTITVTGQNFLPAQPNINVVIGPCHNCGASAVATQTVSSSSKGDFTATMTIPANTPPGTLVATAFNQPGTLDVGLQHPDGSKSFAVTAAPTPTPSPTPKPSPTPTSTPTATTAPGVTPTATPAQSQGGGGNTGLVVALVIALGVVLLFVAAMVIVLASRQPPTPPSSGGYVEPAYTPPADYDPNRPSVYPGQGGGARPVDPDDPTDPDIRVPRGR
jgi:hypothetical protein